MKAGEPLIPLTGVRLVPRGAVRALFWVGLAFALQAAGVVVYGVAAGKLERTLSQAGASAFVAAYAWITAAVATRGDRRARATAPLVFAHVRPRPPLPVRPVAAAVALALAGVGLLWGAEAALRTGVPTAGILGGVWLYVVMYRLHMHRQATAVFALYADGMLDAAATAAIDDARRKDPEFDAAVTEHQRICAQVARQVR
jgi:hypothetical protein